MTAVMANSEKWNMDMMTMYLENHEKKHLNHFIHLVRPILLKDVVPAERKVNIISIKADCGSKAK